MHFILANHTADEFPFLQVEANFRLPYYFVPYYLVSYYFVLQDFLPLYSYLAAHKARRATRIALVVREEGGISLLA